MEDETKKKGGFKNFLYSVFIKDWQYKIFSILCGGLFWVLVVGLL